MVSPIPPRLGSSETKKAKQNFPSFSGFGGRRPFAAKSASRVTRTSRSPLTRSDGDFTSRVACLPPEPLVTPGAFPAKRRRGVRLKARTGDRHDVASGNHGLEGGAGPVGRDGDEPGRARDRVRRHRHEPALHVQDRARLYRRASQRSGSARRAVADPVDFVHHHDRQIRQFRDADRQRRRGRHHRADDPAWGEEGPSPDHHCDGSVRRRAHLWRRRDHAGDFGAVGAGGHGAGRSDSDDLCAAAPSGR